jgi:HEAT repeat protein
MIQKRTNIPSHNVIFLSIIIVITACSPIHMNATPSMTPTADELISRLSSPDVNQRAEAANDIGLYYSNYPDRDRFLPYLINALNEPECGYSCVKVRVFACNSVRILGIYNEKANNTLIGWLGEEGHSPEEILCSIQTLRIYAEHSQAAVSYLIKLLMDADKYSPYSDQIQEASALTLSVIGDAKSVPYLASVLLRNNEPNWVHKSVAISLARFGSSSKCSLPYLIPLLDSSEDEKSIGAALVMSQSMEISFPDSERQNWDPELLGPWIFQKNEKGQYLIVSSAKQWRDNLDTKIAWPSCEGLNGIEVTPSP